MAARKVAVVVGSLRKDSYNRKLAHVLEELAGPALAFDYVDIGSVPLYNQDSDADPPESFRTLRARIKAAEAVLFVTPEYNRSVPGVLKNAIDVASRPYGQSAWDGKPCAVISASPGPTGGFGANHHLRQSLVFLNMPALQFESYISGVDKQFDAEGKLTNDSTRKFLTKFVQRFTEWIERNLRA
jgi:chromate reductase